MSFSSRAPAFFFRPESWCTEVDMEVDQENDDVSNVSKSLKNYSMSSKTSKTSKTANPSTTICGKGVVCTGFSPSVCTKCKKTMCKGCTDRCLDCGNSTTPVTSNQYFIASYMLKRK